MKILLLFLIMFPWLHPENNVDISKVRILYRDAPTTKSAYDKFSALLSIVDSSFSPVMQCYKGASIMIGAKYSINPLTKWNKFNKGKGLIESSINRDSLNLEMRFIRLSVQSNLPLFLGYHNELASDKHFLQQHINETGDLGLKRMVTEYLTSLTYLKPLDNVHNN